MRQKERLLGAGWNDYRKGVNDLRAHNKNKLRLHAAELFSLTVSAYSTAKLVSSNIQIEHLKKGKKPSLMRFNGWVRTAW